MEVEPVTFAPDLDNKLKTLVKKPRKEFEGEGRVVITLDNVLQASRISQLYYECYLSAKYEDSIKIISTSKVHSAQEELSSWIDVIPELSNVDLADADPARYLLVQQSKQSKQDFTRGEKVIVVNSIEDLYELFTTCIQYAFFNRRKKKLSDEFEMAADRMHEIKNRYHLSGRYKRNARVDKDNRPKRQKRTTDYLSKFKRSNKQNNIGLDEIA